MKGKLVAAGGAAVVLAVGAGLGAREAGVGQSAKCAPPITMLDSEIDASIQVLESYISSEIAPTFKHPKELGWSVSTSNPEVLPNRVSFIGQVGESPDGFGNYYGAHKVYQVVLARDCAGGKWRVKTFKVLNA